MSVSTSVKCLAAFQNALQFDQKAYIGDTGIIVNRVLDLSTSESTLSAVIRHSLKHGTE